MAAGAGGVRGWNGLGAACVGAGCAAGVAVAAGDAAFCAGTAVCAGCGAAGRKGRGAACAATGVCGAAATCAAGLAAVGSAAAWATVALGALFSSMVRLALPQVGGVFTADDCAAWACVTTGCSATGSAGFAVVACAAGFSAFTGSDAGLVALGAVVWQPRRFPPSP